MNLPIYLIDILNNQYDENTVKSILEGYSVNRFVTLRVNTLKSTVNEIIQQFNMLGIEYNSVKWSNNAFIIKNVDEKYLQNLDLYKEGKIYLQSLSSMLPPIILEPQENVDILDMAAAPGGKTTQIAALTNNKSHITACEMNHIRAERLKYNIDKQGANCVYIMQTDSRKINDFFSFDQILLDAPCSGSGTLSQKDENLSNTFTKKLIDKSISSQTQLLKKALNILKPGHEMVYSTCSILSCENENVVNKILKETKAEIVPINFEGIDDLPLLSTKIPGTLCICPNELYEGFFVAKIRKIL